MFRQYGQLTEDQRQLAVVAVLELEQHLERVLRDHFRYIGVVAAVERGAAFDQGVEGEHHVFGADRLAIVEASLRAQIETDPAVVRGFFDLPGDQAVFGKGLIEAGAGQGVVDQFDVVCRHPLADERVEAVETAETVLAEYTALGRIRVHVVEVLEVGRILRRFVVQGHRMLR